MNTLSLSEILGQEIADLRFQFIQENEYGMQSFHSYIKLASSNIIIDIPKLDFDDYLELTPENLDFLKRAFDTGKIIDDNLKAYFVGQTIIDFYFPYVDNEIDLSYSTFVKLSNGYYLTERNYGPPGLPGVDLKILDEDQFVKELIRLSKSSVDIRSYAKSRNI